MKKKIKFTRNKNKYNKNNITIKKLPQYGGNNKISNDQINRLLNTRLLNTRLLKKKDFMMTQDKYLIFYKYNRKQVLLFEKKNKNIIITKRIKFNNINDINDINYKDNSVHCYLLDIKNHSNHVIFDNNDNINNIFVYEIINVPNKRGGGGGNYTNIKNLLNNQDLPELYISKQKKIKFDIDKKDEKLKNFLSDIICDFEDIDDFDKKIFINNDNKYNNLEELYLKYYKFIDFESININVFKRNLINENKKKNPDFNVVKNIFYENYCKAVQNKYNIFLDNVYDENKNKQQYIHSNFKTILDDSNRLGEYIYNENYRILFELILLKVILIINIHLGGNFYYQGNNYIYKNILFYLIDNNYDFTKLKLIINLKEIVNSLKKNKNTYDFLDTETINYEKILFKYIISIMLYTSSNKFDKFVKNEICGKKTNVKMYYLSVDNCKNKYNNDICRLANYTILTSRPYADKFMYDEYAMKIRKNSNNISLQNNEREKYYYFYYFHDRFNYYINQKKSTSNNNISNILTHIINNDDDNQFALFYGVPTLVIHIANVKEFLNIVVDNNLKALIDLCICYFIHRLKNISIEDQEFSLKIEKINMNGHYNNVHGSFIDTLNKHQHAHIISMYYDLKETCVFM